MGSGKMLDPTGKAFHRLDMRPGCSLMPRTDHHLAAKGYAQLEPAVAGVPSRTGTRPPASLREAGAKIVRKLFDVVRDLRMRSRERRMPLELDDRVLRDIGLTRVGYRFLHMSRTTSVPDRSQNSRNLHDRPPALF
jgi:uncharacterized protein YjiS (DUF1127 family)